MGQKDRRDPTKGSDGQRWGQRWAWLGPGDFQAGSEAAPPANLGRWRGSGTRRGPICQGPGLREPGLFREPPFCPPTCPILFYKHAVPSPLLKDLREPHMGLHYHPRLPSESAMNQAARTLGIQHLGHARWPWRSRPGQGQSAEASLLGLRMAVINSVSLHRPPPQTPQVSLSLSKLSQSCGIRATIMTSS